jgi:uncharacterized protein YjbI with pentapeptide repeats
MTKRQRINNAPLFVAISATLLTALGMAAAVAVAAVWAATWPKSPNLADVPNSQRISLLQLSLATAAFMGGVVALTVAYRKQRLAEAAHELALAQESREDTRVFNERFGSATVQLGHEKSAVRLAGVYAIAGLADDWFHQRQTCVDVLCAYLRMPYDPATSPPGESEVRRTIVETIADHLRPDVLTPASWTGLILNFTGALLESPSFVNADFRDAIVIFDRATFIGRRATFYRARIENSTLFFRRARFECKDLSFEAAVIGPSATLNFEGSYFGATAFSFTDAKLRRSRISLIEAQLDCMIDISRIEIGDSTFAHSAEWLPPPLISSYAVVESHDDPWREYGPQGVEP